jgi:hypothetical protein
MKQYINESETFGFTIGKKYPGCVNQRVVCIGGGIGGNWAGSMERALEVASWVKNLGIYPGSQKRSMKNTASKRRSDHWEGSTDSYGVDIGCSLKQGDEGFKIIKDKLVKLGWITQKDADSKKWKPARGTYSSFTRDGYRYQVIWRSDSNHDDHIHVGVRNTNESPSEFKKSEVDGKEPTKKDQKSTEETPKIKKIFYTAFSSGEQSIIKSVLEKLGTLGVKDNFSKIVLASLVIYKKDSIVKGETTSNSEAETFIGDLKDKTFNTLDECLDFFEKELGKREFNKSEIKTIAEKFDVKVSDDTGNEIKIDLEKIKIFMRKFKEVFGKQDVTEIEEPKIDLKKEEENVKLNEELNRMKDLMKKIL